MARLFSGTSPRSAARNALEPEADKRQQRFKNFSIYYCSEDGFVGHRLQMTCMALLA